MTIYRGAGGSGDATNDATVTAVAAYATQAATSATNASGSATSSSTSATNAAASASSASSSATNAASSASQAASSQSAAATSATQAANSASTAGTQATTATNAANSASSNASTASSAATNAATSASAAATSASNAATSATNASNSAASALAIYGNTTAMNAAVTTATNASNTAASSASTATTAATNANQSSIEAQASSTTAQAAAANASAIYGNVAALNTAVTSAQNSAANAATSASSVTSSVSAAATSATNAANSATQAAASASSAAAITLGVGSDRASIRPSLLLDFANTKQLDPRVTFQRASTGTYFDYDGILKTALVDQPRFDVDPVTGESKGLLIEEQRTNLLTYSEQFYNGAWSGLRCSIAANSVIAPDGTLTADKLVEDTTATNTHSLNQVTTVALTSGTAYTLSFYVKAADRGFIALRFETTSSVFNGAITYFNLTSGTVVSVGTGTTASITSVGNGWYRCVATQNAAASATARLSIYLSETGTSVSYSGNGYSGMYIWGAQLEAGSFATSYIPTFGSQVTRSADSASITGVNFSGWYRADEGTVYSEAQCPSAGLATTFHILSVNDGSSNNETRQTFNSGLMYGVVAASGSNVAVLSTGITASNVNKGSLTYKVNDFANSVNGAAVTTDTSGALPVGINKLYLGVSSNNTFYLNGTIKRIAYYPKRLSNTELQGITNNS